MCLIKKIKKRNGKIVPFDQEKITNAVFKAAQSVGGSDRNIAEKISRQVVKIIDERYGSINVPGVEDIQDVVEYVLVEGGHYKTAKSFILYRQKHKQIREIKDSMVDVREVINEYLGKAQWALNENSNEQYSFSGLLLYIGGELIKTYALSEMYAGPMAEAHRSGYIHIHDLSHSVIGYCAGWSLKNLIKQGFGGVRGKVNCRPAKHLRTLVHQMVNYIGCLQMEWAGAQAFSSVDTFLAPFVKKDKLSQEHVKQAMQELIFSLNVPARWGSQAPFSNLTFDWTVPEDMKETRAIVGGIEQDFTYGDCQKEMDMINRGFLEVMHGGDASGAVFTFPIPTYNLTKDFDWDSENANLLFNVTAKYGLPYFQNYISSGLDPKSIRAMCCRLNLDLNQLVRRPGHAFAMGDSTGSLGVVTINLNRLGYIAKSREDYFAKLKYYMDLAKQSLEIKRKQVQQNMDRGLMPYSKVYLGTLRNHFSTIGLCGMNECCLNFLGRDISSKEGKEFTIETLQFMRDVLTQFQLETGNLYNLEATPAESTSYRFARLDTAEYPDIITCGKEVPYLTNSTNLPVDKTDDLWSALEHQNDIQPLYTGGTMFHTFLGQRLPTAQSAMALVKKIASNTKLPYFSITPTFSICKAHGYINGEHFNCPECGQPAEVYSRVVGYYRPVQQWNRGKQEEFKDRLEYAQEFSKEISMETQNAPPVEVEVQLSNSLVGISKYEIYTMPNCEKCASLKEFLTAAAIAGHEINLGSDDGLAQFKSVYQTARPMLPRNSDGSLPIPAVLFYDDKDKLVTAAHTIDQVKQAMENGV